MQKTEKKKKSKNNIKTNSTTPKKPDSIKDTNESTSPTRENRASIKPTTPALACAWITYRAAGLFRPLMHHPGGTLY
jgi:hypothetical protein